MKPRLMNLGLGSPLEMKSKRAGRVVSSPVWILLVIGYFGLVSGLYGGSPNILFIVSEDNGPEIGCYGAPVETPHLDKLASRGTLFENAYTPQAGCSQARAVFLTGLYPHQNGQIGLATWKYAMYSEKIPNVVRTLGEAGYRTGIIGKLHVNPASAFPFDFKAIPGANFGRKDMAAYAKEAAKFMGQGEEPFYLQVNYPDAHRPFLKSVDGLPSKPLEGKDVETLPFVGIPHPEMRQQTADYYNCMMRLDSYIGELLAELEKSGKAEDTIIVYIGDHGADFPRGKRTCYEGGVRIPMIVHWPGKKCGQRREELVSLIDLFPTFCEWAGIPVPGHLPGLSLVPLIRGRKVEWREHLFTEYHTHSNHNPWPQRTVRNGRYKLIWNMLAGEVNPGYGWAIGSKFFSAPEEELLSRSSGRVRKAYKLSEKPTAWELYDLQEDPFEFNNLAGIDKFKKVQDGLSQVLKEWMDKTGDTAVKGDSPRKLFNMISAAGISQRKALDYKAFMMPNAARRIAWDLLPPLPGPHGFASPFAGVVEDTLVVAGGANFPDGYPWEGGKKVWHDRIFLLYKDATAWEVPVARLPRPMAYGVSASLPQLGIVVMAGGSDQRNQPVREVLALGMSRKDVRLKPLPPLPVPLAESSGLSVGKTVYVFSGRSGKSTVRKAYRMDFEQNPLRWEVLPWPNGARGRMHSVAAYLDGQIYLFGGRDFQSGTQLQHPQDRLEAEKLDFLRDGYRLDLDSMEWSRVSDLPQGMSAAPYVAVPHSDSDLFIIGGVSAGFVEEQVRMRPGLNGQGHAHPGFSRKIWGYNIPGDSWSEVGAIPSRFDVPVTTPAILLPGGHFILPTGEIKPGVRTNQVLRGALPPW